MCRDSAGCPLLEGLCVCASFNARTLTPWISKFHIRNPLLSTSALKWWHKAPAQFLAGSVVVAATYTYLGFLPTSFDEWWCPLSNGNTIGILCLFPAGEGEKEPGSIHVYTVFCSIHRMGTIYKIENLGVFHEHCSLNPMWVSAPVVN